MLAVVELPGNLVDAMWLRSNIGAPGLVVADVRWHPDGDGRAAYEAGHLPAAVFLDAEDDLAARPFIDGPGRHPLPSPASFASTMQAAGIGDDDAVIAYDDAGGSHAARLWWMLRAIGHACAVLDGGLGAWDGELETGVARRGRASFTPREWPSDRIAGAERVADELRAGSAVVLDARAAERYRGEAEPIDPVAGHIPGAASAPWADNLDPRTGRFRRPDELRRRFEAIGVRKGGDPIVYCGSGLTATHDLLAIEVAGLGRGRLYEGSWSGWIDDPKRAVATGPPGERSSPS
jgi:thiosulfate/3-mercaptopyruvate sulfurtransferase